MKLFIVIVYIKLKNGLKMEKGISFVIKNYEELSSSLGNIYESTVIISIRSKQISLRLKEDINNSISDFVSNIDNLEEVFENKEQIAISKNYESLPKPNIVATSEFLNNEIMYRYNK